ncbi:hypothetical protein BpHYR1_046872 [Brachionus plicatilis]|uniref:Uncharacterized protein n=1 Tax=Brachionus plicatilis TaxID=10195 RepID=A0A3M7TAV1_BRAPC|nr:hypothetical protein BpHYR1_046872 [Brachionus plicatilis]
MHHYFNFVLAVFNKLIDKLSSKPNFFFFSQKLKNKMKKDESLKILISRKHKQSFIFIFERA